MTGVAGPVAHDFAARLVATLDTDGGQLAFAESLTGGLLSASVVDVPGASRVLCGGVVSYSLDVKQAVLGVSAEQLALTGAVDPEVARAMALGVARQFRLAPGALVVSTTGVAGPGADAGHPAGEVWIAAGRIPTVRVRHFVFDGGRADVRRQAVEAALSAALDAWAGTGEWDG